jgi:Ca2+-binding RTX toxin-like protein
MGPNGPLPLEGETPGCQRRLTPWKSLMASFSGTDGRDYLTGNSTGDRLNGLGGVDTLDGAAGNDSLFGGSQDDFFLFNAARNYGSDLLNGGSGTDTLVVGDFSRAVVDFRNGTVVGGGANGSGRVRFSDMESASGGPFNDRLIGHDADIQLLGGGGNDTIYGGAGDDILYADAGFEWTGRIGNDYLFGGGGNDLLLSHGGRDRIDGGPGTDAIRAEYLDLTKVPNSRLTNIEVIRMEGPFGELRLSGRDILDMSSTTNTLRVDAGRESDHQVDIVGRFTDQGVSGGYHRYKVGAATLLLDTDITDVS